ncbi:AAA family ATPase [Labilibaculum sp. A4]|uniref:UvrD-helicase domain-containing protein n=1 Tax=Labilibaculum euxinus TaxID=2686357 RepID=UPI000F61F410|nr:UvrD-helicase domain-containing protein [Labilibaculum euxinus]MDQ1771018.1 AAA family ATPase [Labilibaculum euxinus]MWN76971.1 AAA family ATPase [Labilibaculum euxinus]
MVETRLELEPEVQEILKCIDNNQNFLLSGGAGSGKTYSLVQVIRQVIKENPTAQVACMTYTNAAVKEIEERVDHKNLSVSTIHDFLWDNIKHFQKELKSTLIALSNNVDVKRINIEDDNVPDNFYDECKDGIQYKEFLRLKDGIISHDELLILTNGMFEKYPSLSGILKDKFKFIFIDEYQDTNKLVIEIFLEHLIKSTKSNIIGLFGDSMQAIYDDGIGNVDVYKGDAVDNLKEIKKNQNRRNPQLIIDLANLLRTDGIIQKASLDVLAPNMVDEKIKDGEIKFIYSSDGNIDHVKDFLSKELYWDFTNLKETKELNLTHNLIADKAGFIGLMDIYDKDPVISLKKDILNKIKYNKKNNKPEIEIEEEDTFDIVVDKFALKNRQRLLKKDVLLQEPANLLLYNQLKDKPFSIVRKIYLTKDSLIDNKKQDTEEENRKGSKRDKLIKHLFKIQSNISLYSDKKYNDFLRITDFRNQIRRIEDKRILKGNIEELMNVGMKTIEEVINDANDKGICLIDDHITDFKNRNEYLYNRVKDIPFKEFQNLYQYLEGYTPFSTQHKTKGAEFNNVFVILDNGKWNDYNFEYLFTNRVDKESVLKRTQKIFYVCCTRAKEKLAVYYHNPSTEIIDQAKEWFGVDNVIPL